MASDRVVVTKELLRAAMTNPVVRAALREVAQIVYENADRIARAEGADGFADSMRVEHGTRPGTNSPVGLARPYSRVMVAALDAAEREYGDVGVVKLAILARAAARSQ